MRIGCIFGPLWRLRKKSPITAPRVPHCPACLELCPPPSYTPDGPSIDAPITIPCSQTYHPACLRDLFNSAKYQGQIPRCCGVPIPLSTLAQLYPATKEQGQDEDKTAKETEKSELPTLSTVMAEFKEITPYPVDCTHCGRWVLPEDIDEELERGFCNPAHGGCEKFTCVVCLKDGHPVPENGRPVPTPKVSPVLNEKGMLGGRKRRKKKKPINIVKYCPNAGDKEYAEVRFNRLVGKEGWRACSSCGWMLSRDTGCCEVLCVCGNYETLYF